MDHLPWYSQSGVTPVKVPFICGNEALCDKDNFSDFPSSQGWELGKSTSLAQLAQLVAMAQAWLFFGLLAVAGITPDVCISSDVSGTDEQVINTSQLFVNLSASLKISNGRANLSIIDSLIEAEDVMENKIIPLIREFEKEEHLTLWNSRSYAVLFSIDILIDSLGYNIQLSRPERKSLFPKGTAGVANSLRQVGRCGSLARRLNLRSADFYLLISLPNGADNEDHSQCNQNSCRCFDVDPISYRPRHTEDCMLCEDVSIAEKDLVKIIQKDEVPLIRSTMDFDGNVTICITKMSMDVDYTAISHVWAGGLGNFESNLLPQCQLQAIHQDICSISALASNDPGHMNAYVRSQINQKSLKPKSSGKRSWLRFRKKSVCYYWLDTLCIPVDHADERCRAINSMGPIYAGAVSVLVLDPALSRIHYNDLGDKRIRTARGDLLISASPWMARSWPLQEAALAPSIYVKFADSFTLYRHSQLGIVANLPSIPNQKENEEQLSWYGVLRHDFGHGVDYGEGPSYLPDADFIKIWNLLTKRTTSCPEDVPAIFAALLHRSAGEILAIKPNLRSRALLLALESLPLDIMCVEQDIQERQSMSQFLGWAPKLPGSKQPVSALSSRWGILKRVPNGFFVVYNKAEPMATRAMICSSGVITSGHSVLRDVDSQEAFQLHIDPSFSGSTKPSSAQLLLLFSKQHPHAPSYYSGVLCSVMVESEDFLTVHIDTTFSWTCEKNTVAGDGIIECSKVDASRKILIEMNLKQWPILTWTRFTAFPFQHLQAQRIDTGRTQTFYLVYSTLLPIFFTSLFSLLVLIDSHFPSSGIPEEWHPYVLPCFIGTVVSIIPQWYFANLDSAYASSAMARRARHMWALSFWDVEHARKTLSCCGGSVSLALFIRTFIPVVINVSILVWGIRSGAAKSVIFFGMVPGLFTHVVRLLFLAFLQARWFFSTFEFHSYPSWVVPHLQLVGELMRVHFFRVLFVVLAGAFAGVCAAMTSLHFWIVMSVYNADVLLEGLKAILSFGAMMAISAVLLLFWIGAGCGCVVFIGCQLRLLLIDVGRRVREAYAPNTSVRLV